MIAASRRQFVDTNVLVYAYDETAENRHTRARELVDALWDAGNGALSIQVLQEFFVTTTRRIPRKLDPERAAGIVADLGSWLVHSPAVDDVLRAIEIHRQSKISLWDALIVRSAKQLGCELLWSEDLQTGRRYDGVLVRSPFA